MSDNVAYTPGSGATVAARLGTYSGDSALAQAVGLVTFSGSDDSKTITDVPGGAGTEAAAIRVTLPTDCTGVLTVKQATAGNLNATIVGTGTFAVQAAITAASGSVASGAIASGALASGSIAAGAIAAGATSIAANEDDASADLDRGVKVLAVRKATPANTSGTDGDYEFIQMSAGRLWASATIDAALPAGANAIGKLAANSGVDIGDVDVTSVPADPFGVNADAASATGSISAKLRFIAGTGIPITGTVTVGTHAITVASGGIASGAIASGAIASGAVASGAIASGAIAAGAIAAGATSIADNEDVASADGDRGVKVLAVRKATPANTSGTDGDYEFLQMSAGRVWASATVDAALPAGTNNIGDVDVLTVPADPFGANADASSATGSISAKLRFIAGTGIPITGTVTVGSHAVTNAGTFAVQVDGAALTSLQLIDDTVVAQGTALGSTKNSLIGGSVTTAAPSYTTGQISPLSLDVNGGLRVNVIAGAGSGGASIVDDAAFTVAGSSLTPVGGTYIPAKDAVDSGDAGAFAMTQYRAMHAHLVDAAGDAVSVGGGTQYTQDAALTVATSVGTIAMGRASAAAPTGVSADNDAVMPWYLRSGAAAVNLTAAGALIPGDATDGLLVNLGANNDITVTGNVTVTQGVATALKTQAECFQGSTAVSSSNPLQVTLANTGANTNKILVTPDANSAINVAQVAGSTVSTAATGVQKVGIVGNAGATVDSTVGAGTAPTNQVVTGGIYNTTAPAPTNGQAVAQQLDQAGNSRVFPGISLAALSVWNSGTSVNATQTVFSLSGAAAVLVHLVQSSGSFSAGAITFEVTYDNTNWITISADAVVDPTSATGATVAVPYALVTSTNKGFLILPKGAQGLRIKLSTAITGTGTVTPNYALLAAAPLQQVVIPGTVTVASHAVTNAGTFLVQENGSQVQVDDAAFTPATSKIVMVGFQADEASTDSVDEGDGGAARMTLDRKVIVNPQPHTAGGLSTYHLVSAGSTNAAVVKASAGMLYGWYIYNSNAAARKLAFHNSASSPTAGASIFFTVVIPPLSAANILGAIGIEFTSGIAITTVTELTDAGSTGVAASDLIINLFYK